MKKPSWYNPKVLEPKYIETPLTKYVGGEDKIIWPYIFVFLTIGGTVGMLCL